MDDVYENIDDYNLGKKRKKLIVFDDMIADIMTNKKFQARNFYYSVLFSCPKRCQIKFNTLFDYENKQQKRITKYCN